MSENINLFFDDAITDTEEKVCLVWLNLLEHIASFASSEKLGMHKKCIGEYALCSEWALSNSAPTPNHFHSYPPTPSYPK